MLVSLAFQLIYIFFLFCFLNQLGRPKITGNMDQPTLQFIILLEFGGVGEGVWERASKVIYRFFLPKSLMAISYYDFFLRYRLLRDAISQL